MGKNVLSGFDACCSGCNVAGSHRCDLRGRARTHQQVGNDV
jgi:hypothetical protein